jgi:hypothetical protein
MRRVTYACVILLLSVKVVLGASVDDYYRGVRGMLDAAPDVLRPKLNSREQQIVDSIDYRASRQMYFQGYADKDLNEKRSVTIYVGVPIIFDLLSQALFVTQKGMENCANTYTRDLILTALFNSSPGLPVQLRRPVTDLVTYAKLEPVCQGADQVILNATDPERELMHAKMVRSTEFIIFHEIAHQVLGHTDHHFSTPPSKEELEQSRHNEDAADRWALAKLVDLEVPISLTAPAMLVMMMVSQTTWEGEQADTHPAGTKRAAVILDDIIAELRRQNATPERIQKLEEFKQVLIRLAPQAPL